MTRPEALRFNNLYRSTHDGTGSWTRSLLDLDIGWETPHPSLDPSRQERLAFLQKTLFELAFRTKGGRLRVHPYAAATLDRSAALVILNVPFDQRSQRGWYPLLVRRSIAMADRLATISREQQQLLAKRHGRTFALLTPHPEPDFFALPLPYPPRAGDTTVVAYWGGWHARKGMGDLLATITPSPEFQFVVTGSPPEHIANRPDVTTAGSLCTSELIRLIDSATIAAYPSRAEGFGLPVYEALLRDKPVVARRLAPYEDFVRTNQAAGVHWFDDDNQFLSALRQAGSAAKQGVPARASLRTPDLPDAQALLQTQLHQWLS